MVKCIRSLWVSVLVCAVLAPTASAQFAVVDIGAIAQLVQQIQTMTQQLSTMQAHLQQAKQQYESLTGDRGMQHLLEGTVRNYLPADWTQLQGAVNQTAGGFPALTTAIQATMRANAVLTDVQLASLSVAERTHLMAARQSAAMLQATTQQALAVTSARFAAIQQLIAAIARAKDAKAVLDLQARISAEQGMLENDQTKLQVLYQGAQAQQWALQQRAREQAVADIGSLRRLPAMGL